MKTHTVELSKIRIDAGTQSRTDIDESIVQEYHEALEYGSDLPPITVFFDGLQYYVADGFHRYHAHRRSEREFIECFVESGTVRDAVKFSLSANATHGLRRSNADKRKAVLTVLNDPEWSELTLREMAEMCAVSHVFVLKVKKELEAPKQDKPQQKPVKLNTVIEEDLSDPLVTLPEQDEFVNEVVAENERLKDRLAVEAMDASEEEKALAQETIEDLRAQVKSLTVELEAVKRSRDQYQMECSQLKKQIKMMQRQAKN